MTESRVSELLNSLGISGPNIRHELATGPDPKRDAEDWPPVGSDEDWCVCGRIWPCEALELANLVKPTEATVEAFMDASHRFCVWTDGNFALRHPVEYHRHQGEFMRAMLAGDTAALEDVKRRILGYRR